MDYPTGTKYTGGGMLAPSDTAIRIYNVHFRCTATPSNVVLINSSGTVTASNTSTALPYIAIDNDGVGTCGNYDNGVGVFFPNGVFIQTSANVSLVTVSYRTEKF